jgi:hypothetical protein
MKAPAISEDDRLRGWKEIGVVLRACERSAQRWEHTHWLPIYRVHTARRAMVYASRKELELWLCSDAGRAARAEEGLPRLGNRMKAAPTSAEIDGNASLGGPHGFETEASSPDSEPPRPRVWRRRAAVPALLTILFAVVGFAVWRVSPAVVRMSRPGPNPGDTLMFRLTFANGRTATFGTPCGELVTSKLPTGKFLALSAEPARAGIILNVYEIDAEKQAAGAPPEQLASVPLEVGAHATIRKGHSGEVDVQWTKTLLHAAAPHK